ncbi:origin recognition complex subunit 1 [Calycina marina]|uniref:Origin recognition complex subunit 1 n=1 Tax=Calycina marina TaxID=1763456 RepID=A0A9P7ZBA7_9HELO|nr:origin recognition complex subunit 1 [Calycina marina]
MPPQSKTPTSKNKQEAKALLARKLLAGSTQHDEDAEKDLDDEGIPWQWIEADNGNTTDIAVNHATPSRKSKVRSGVKRIIGARKGRFECKIGDCLVLKSDRNDIWAGIACEFREDGDEDDLCVSIMWFQAESDIKNGVKKRKDYLPSERYASLHLNFTPLESIGGKAIILSEKAYNAIFPPGQKTNKKSKNYNKTFICRRGVEARTSRYTNPFDWEEMYKGGEAGVEQLSKFIKQEIPPLSKVASTKAKAQSNKRQLEEIHNEVVSTEEEDDELGELDVIEEDDGSEDGRKKPKKRKRAISTASTPRKKRTPSKVITPRRNQKYTVKKPLEFTPLGTRMLAADHVFSSPFQNARSKLHVSAVPTALPCREDEFATVYSHLEAAISDGSGACIYISGTPGTGKTATVREVIAQLNASVQAEELEEFIFVEINGMKVTDPHQSYSLLWEALRDERVSPFQALGLLEREFSQPSPRRVPCVVLMDELDQLVTKNQSVMYNFFNWPGLRHSKLIVLAVANTMDLPERTLSNKISSRLGLTRITFPGYTHEQLMKIIQSRLEGVPGNIVESDAIAFASRKVAAVSGDARRALDICRRAVELAEADMYDSASAPNTPSKTPKSAKPVKNLGVVTITTIRRAILEATTSPLQQYLRSLPLASKVLLAALLTKIRRSGISESVLGEVLDEAKRMSKMYTGGNAIEYLFQDGKSSSQLSANQMLKTPRILAMGSSAIGLMEAGIIGLETRRADRTGKIRLSIGEEDVKLAFKGDPEVKGLGF